MIIITMVMMLIMVNMEKVLIYLYCEDNFALDIWWHEEW